MEYSTELTLVIIQLIAISFATALFIAVTLVHCLENKLRIAEMIILIGVGISMIIEIGINIYLFIFSHL